MTQREKLIDLISRSYARRDFQPTSPATLALYRADAEHAADAILAAGFGLSATAYAKGRADLFEELREFARKS